MQGSGARWSVLDGHHPSTHDLSMRGSVTANTITLQLIHANNYDFFKDK